MTDQAEPGRPPAHDLSAFDLTKRSPEQLAQSFARWKAQRKRPPEAEATRTSPPVPAQLSPAIAKDTTPDPSSVNEAAAPKETPVKRSKSVEYSDTFSALLAAGSEPTVQRTVWTPVATRPSPKRNGSPGRRLKAMSVLAGAASVLALAGGALLELSDWRDSTEAEPEVAQIHPQQFPTAGPIAAAATRAPAVEWKLQRTVDLALMKAAPDADAAKPMQPAPEPPAVQTASKAAIAAPPGPVSKKAAPETEQFVAKPFVPSAAPSPAVVPAAQKTAAIPVPPVAAAIRSADPRPDALFQLGRDKSTSGNGALSNRVASDGKPAAATGSERAVDPRSATTRTATARSGKVASSGNGDPRGEGSGGARVAPGISGETGDIAGDGDASAGADAGGGTTGDDGPTGGGSPSSGAGGGDTGSADTGGSDTGGSDAGGSDTGDNGTGDSDTGGSDAGDSGTGSSDTGGDDAGNGAPSDAGSGDGESSNGEDGDSGGIGGAISGALDGAGDTLGDALGGTNGNPDSNDKDQRN